MSQSRNRVLIVALAVVTLVALPAFAASAAAPCKGDASTALGRADIWRTALERFTTGHADLTPEQAQFVGQAVKLGEDLAQQPEDVRAQVSFARKARRIVERSHELFTHRELGELYSAMGGPMQKWLAEVTAMTPFCDCAGSGSCTGPAGGPTGTCQAGCLSWDGTDGVRRDGLCGTAAAE